MFVITLLALVTILLSHSTIRAEAIYDELGQEENHDNIEKQSEASIVTVVNEQTIIPYLAEPLPPDASTFEKLKEHLSKLYHDFRTSEAVWKVLRKTVNGVLIGLMDVVSLFVPVKFMPVVTTLATVLFPYDSTKILRSWRPPETHRRSYSTELNSLDNYDQGNPYMARRFTRHPYNDEGMPQPYRRMQRYTEKQLE